MDWEDCHNNLRAPPQKSGVSGLDGGTHEQEVEVWLPVLVLVLAGKSWASRFPSAKMHTGPQGPFQLALCNLLPLWRRGPLPSW